MVFLLLDFLDIRFYIYWLYWTGALEKRGVGALELVAMDMKARYALHY